MLALTDPVYLAGRVAVDRVSPLIALDSNTAIGSTYWNLRNELDYARGDTIIGGTPALAEIRARVLTPSGELQPAMRSEIATHTASLNAAFPVATTTPPVVTGPPIVAVDGGFLGGILDGNILGIPKTYLAIGVAAYFLLKD